MAFDYVAAPLRCPMCNEVSSDPLAIDLQTKIAKSPAGNMIRPGDTVALIDDPREPGYLLLNPGWQPGGSVLRVIQAWSCPYCATNPLWAVLTFQNGTLISVEPVPLDAATLAAADFITAEALLLVPLQEVPRVRELPPEELRRELAKAAKAGLA